METSLTSRIETIRQVLSEGNLVEAEELCADLRRDYPDEWEPIQWLTQVLIEKGDSPAAHAQAIAGHEKHRSGQSSALVGLCRYHLGRYEEAIPYLEEALRLAPEYQDIDSIGLLGLCYEKTGEWPKAEGYLRQALESDPSYITRYSTMAMHAYNPYMAFLHYMLARTLQQQGKNKEAHLHYHLAVRNHPGIELDPMYLDIISRTDLENHPYFDDPQLNEADPPELNGENPETFIEVLRYLLHRNDYDELEELIRTRYAHLDTDRLGSLIRALQIDGQFYLSAQVRLFGNILLDDPIQALFEALHSNNWKRFFELSELVNSQQISAEEAAQLVQRIHFNDQESEHFYKLLLRFVLVDFQTGRILANLAHALLTNRHGVLPNAFGKALLAECLFLTGEIQTSESLYLEAISLFESAQREDLTISPLESLGRLRQERKQDLPGTTAVYEKLVPLSEQYSQPEHYVRHRLNLSIFLLQQQQFDRAYKNLAPLLSLYASGAFPPSQMERFQEIYAYLADRLQLPAKLELKPSYKQTGVAATYPSIIRHFQEAYSAEDYETALLHLDQGLGNDAISFSQEQLFEIYYLKTYTLAQLGRFEEAKETGLITAHRFQSVRDQAQLTRHYLLLGAIFEQLDEEENAITYLEWALSLSETLQLVEERKEAAQALSRLLMERDPQRALAIFERVFIYGDQSPEDAPDQRLEQADQAFQEGKYREVIGLLQPLLKTDPPDHSKELVMPYALIGESFWRLGDLQAAEQYLANAIAFAEQQQDDRRWIVLLCKRLQLRASKNQDTEKEQENILQAWKSIASPGSRRSLTQVVGETFYSLKAFGRALEVLKAGLELATQDEWKSIRDEMFILGELGKIQRVQGDYQAAEEGYRRAIAIARQIQDRATEAVLQGNRAITLRYLGRLDDAVEAYEEAIRLFRPLNEPMGVANNLFNLAATLFLLKKDQAGQEKARAALEIFDDEGRAAEAARVLLMLGEKIYHGELTVEETLQQRIDETIQLYAEKAIPASFDQSGLVAMAKGLRFEYLFRHGSPDQALPLIDEVIRGYEGAGDIYNMVVSSLKKIDLLLYAGIDEEAEAVIHRCIALARSIDSSLLAAQAYGSLLELGMLRDDLPLIKEQLPLLMEYWRRQRLALKGELDRIAFADSVAGFMERLILYFIGQQLLPEAFMLNQWRQAQVFRDRALAAAPDQLESAAAFTLDIEQLPLAGMSDQLRFVLLNFTLIRDEVQIFCYRPASGDLQLLSTGVTRKELDYIFRDFDTDMHQNRAADFYFWEEPAAALIRPLDEWLLPDELVLISAEGALHHLPLHALALNADERLIQRGPVVYVPELSVLRQPPSISKKTGLGFSWIGAAFPEQAMIIGRIAPGLGLTGNQLDKEQVKKYLEDLEIIHFSTHGYFDDEHPLQSGLILNTEASLDRILLKDVLSIRDLMTWNIQVSLVLLSACETARSSVFRTDYISLDRAFLLAGAKAVISTLWSVFEKPTTQFLAAFYRSLQNGKEADPLINLAEILRQVQLEQIEQNVNLYHWASFKLTGHPLLRNKTIRNEQPKEEN